MINTTPIFDDDYVPSVENPPLPPPPGQHVYRIREMDPNGQIKDTHVQVLTQVGVSENMAGPPGAQTRISRYHRVVTSDKNRHSGIYVQTFPCPLGPTISCGNVYIKK